METSQGEDMFRVDVEGLRRKFANKSKNFLLYELYQNAVDEDVSRVSIQLIQRGENKLCHLVVEDDSPEGFKDLTHSYTLYADSSKINNPEQRGIWNLGEKLVIAFCTEVKISSTKGTVIFSEGRRYNSSEQSERGTLFEGDILMNDAEHEECCKSMMSLIPPEDVEVSFNGKILQTPNCIHEFPCTLPTTIGDDSGAIRKTRRKTLVRLYEARERTGGWIYEMGIPVVPCETKWHCDVQQRVPLNMLRDNVTPAYLQELRVYVLNETPALLEKEDVTTDWARAATNDKRCSNEATIKSLDLRFGEKRVSYDVNDREANKAAQNEGFTVISGGSLSKQEWENAKVAGAVTPAGKICPSCRKEDENEFGEKIANLSKEIDRADWSADMLRVEAFVHQLAPALIGHDVAVRILDRPNWPALASYGNDKLTFNLAKLTHDFFRDRSWKGLQEINELLIHEFAHEYADDHLTRDFYDSMGLLGSRLVKLALKSPEIFSEMIDESRGSDPDDELWTGLSVRCGTM